MAPRISIGAAHDQSPSTESGSAAGFCPPGIRYPVSVRKTETPWSFSMRSVIATYPPEESGEDQRSVLSPERNGSVSKSPLKNCELIPPSSA